MTDLRKCHQCGEWFMATPEVMERHRREVCRNKPPIPPKFTDTLAWLMSQCRALSPREMEEIQRKQAVGMANSYEQRTLQPYMSGLLYSLLGGK